MSPATAQHWTDDEELLEDFVLGRMTGEEWAVCDKHRKRCELCRQRVEDEALLAAAVKSAEHQRMRKHLAARLAAQRPVPWPRIMGIAAILLVAVGIQLLTWKYRKPELETEGSGIREEEFESPTTDTRADIGREKSVPSASPQSQTGQAPAPGEKKETAPPAPHVRSAPKGTASLQKQFVRRSWQVTARPVASAETINDELAATPGQNAVSPEGAAVSTESAHGFEAGLMRVIAAPGDSALIPGRERGGIPALLEQQESEIVLTLYLPSALETAPGPLPYARLRFAGEDSLVVDLHGYQLGLRIPPEAASFLRTSR